MPGHRGKRASLPVTDVVVPGKGGQRGAGDGGVDGQSRPKEFFIGERASSPPRMKVGVELMGQTPEDKMWLVSEAGHDKYPAGSQVRMTVRSVAFGDRGLFVPGAGIGGAVSVELVAKHDLSDFLRLKYQLFRDLLKRDDDALAEGGTGQGVKGDVSKRLASGSGANAGLDDVRTLAVAYDTQGARWKSFREAVVEMTEDHFPDFPLYDPRTVLWLLKYIARQGHTPITWVEAYLSRKQYSSSDRSQHELRFLGEFLEYIVCYDQLNACSLAAVELAARRWALIISAHDRDAQRPDYSGSELFNGLGNDAEGVAPALSKSIARKMRDKAEIDSQRASGRGLPVKTPSSDPSADKAAKGGAKGDKK